MITVIPAYGRDYKSAEAVKAAWTEGKDFLIYDVHSPDDGRYINKEDADKSGITVSIRYKKRRHVCLIPPGIKGGT